MTRRIAAQIAANERWARVTDRTAATQKARDALHRKFEDQVDPDRTLTPDERERRTANAKRAHFLRLAAASARKRRVS